MSHANPSAPIYSIFAAQDDLGGLVEMFVREMPGRIESLLHAVEEEDWVEVGRIAHQLKGSGGSYGFQAVTEVAARLEKNCREQADQASIEVGVLDLVQICRRLRSGLGG